MSFVPRAARRTCLILAPLLAAAAPSTAQLSVTLDVTPSDFQFAGTPVIMTAAAAGSSETPVFQFAYRPLFTSPWRVLRDFYHPDRFDWVTLDAGLYELKVTARVDSTGETAEATGFILVASFGQAVPTVAATTHPLIALYSAPPCAPGGAMLVRFRREGAQFWQYTTPKLCRPSAALNFHVAGLRPDTTYTLQHGVVGGPSPGLGPELTFRSGTPDVPLPVVTVDTPASAATSFLQSVVLQSVIGNVPYSYPVATDLGGEVIWYYPLVQTTLTRPLFGGTMLVLVRDGVNGRILREIDLAGNVVRETNSLEVSRQLVALGHDPIGVFHHEALRLPNGHTLAIASVERILTDVQGPGPVNVYGEIIVDLDENLQVAWAWNGFDHLDASRVAVLGETCTFEGPGCPALFLDPVANDWLHANSIGYVPDDGNLILSLRHQDWVVKIAYEDGTGSGAVLWRLGPEGDFAVQSEDPWPWFSHQHDAKLAGGRMLLYDNGNTRVSEMGDGNSRGQTYDLDESTMTATLDMNLDLGAYASALGSAQPLVNGNFHFDNGFLGSPADPSGEAHETRTDGSSAYVSRVNAFVYRSFRMWDLYRP